MSFSDKSQKLSRSQAIEVYSAALRELKDIFNEGYTDDTTSIIKTARIGMHASNGMTKGMPEYLQSDVMPVEFTTEKKLTVVIHDFSKRGMLPQVAEGGAAPENVVEHTTETVTLSSVGVTFSISGELLQTMAGRLRMNEELLSNGELLQRTINHRAFQAIIRYANKMSDMKRVTTEEEYLKGIQRFNEQFAWVNKYENGLSDMAFNMVHEMEMNNRYTASLKKYLIVPYTKAALIMQNSARFGSYSGSGIKGAELALGRSAAQGTMEIAGARVVMSPEGPEYGSGSLLSRELTVGTYVPLVRPPGVPVEVGQFIAVERYNGCEGMYDRISMLDMFHGCGMFEGGDKGQDDATDQHPLLPRTTAAAATWRLKKEAFYGFGKNADEYKNVSPFLQRSAAGIWEGLEGTNVARTIEQWVNGVGNWPGLQGLAFSPLQRYRMAGAILATEGLGKTFQSEDLTHSVMDPTTMRQVTGFRAQIGAVVTNPDRMVMYHDVFYDGSVRGCDSRPVTDPDYYKENNFVHNPSKGSLFFVVWPAKMKVNGVEVTAWTQNKPHVHLTGFNPFVEERTNPEYPGAGMWANYWGFNRIEFKDIADPDVHLAHYCSLGSYNYFTKDGTPIRVNGNSMHGPTENEHGKLVRKYGNDVVRPM